MNKLTIKLDSTVQTETSLNYDLEILIFIYHFQYVKFEL